MIGRKLKARRIELGLTQEELAHKLGYKSKSTINKIELDKHDVSQEKLLKIAAVLDCSPTYFIDDLPHKSYLPSRILEYAERLSKLPPQCLDNALQYIEFLERKEKA